MPLPSILYEDSTMIAFDKPSGLLVAPDRWDKARANLMAEVHAAMGRTVANVHRLDADTSGLLLCEVEAGLGLSQRPVSVQTGTQGLPLTRGCSSGRRSHEGGVSGTL